MLGKLIKHEFRATGRIMLPLYLVLLVSAVGANLTTRGLLDSRFRMVEVLGVLLVMAFGIAIFGVCLVTFVLMIQRFYKNLLQDEGYLMFMLPVSVHQHVWAKLIVSSAWFVATVLAILAASMIVAYDVGFLRQLFDGIAWFFQGLRKLKITEALNGTVVLAELLVLLFLALAAFSLQFYAALAMGYSRPNHKMLWSVGVFFGLQFAVQFLGSLVLLNLGRFSIPWEPDVSPAVAVHVGMLLSITLVVIYGAIFYVLTTFFLKKHLNLE